jgi:hypothetical protein
VTSLLTTQTNQLPTSTIWEGANELCRIGPWVPSPAAELMKYWRAFVSYYAFLDRVLLLLLTGKLLNQRYLVVKSSLFRKFDGRYHGLAFSWLGVVKNDHEYILDTKLFFLNILIFKIYSSKNVMIIKFKIKLLRHNFCNDNRFLVVFLFGTFGFIESKNV